LFFLIEQGLNFRQCYLMGDFRLGDMIARDGKTVIYDANTFGQEWQVLDTEPSSSIRFVSSASQQVCTLPPPISKPVRRRLGVVLDRSACCGKGLRTLGRVRTIAFRRLDDR
jgi:hypothetical protein